MKENKKIDKYFDLAGVLWTTAVSSIVAARQRGLKKGLKKLEMRASVVYWPSTRPDIPFQRRGSCMFHWRWRAWLTVWSRRSDELETRCGRESHHPAKGALGTPDEFGDPLVTRCGWENSTQQKAVPPGLRLSSPREWETHNADDYKSEGQYIAFLFGLQLPLTHKPFK